MCRNRLCPFSHYNSLDPLAFEHTYLILGAEMSSKIDDAAFLDTLSSRLLNDFRDKVILPTYFHSKPEI